MSQLSKEVFAIIMITERRWRRKGAQTIVNREIRSDHFEFGRGQQQLVRFKFTEGSNDTGTYRGKKARGLLGQIKNQRVEIPN
jgi:hypothetical protein